MHPLILAPRYVPDPYFSFISGIKACRLLGYKRGSRLYSTHPTLFKYTLDSEDKDRLVEASVIPLNSLGKKVNVLVVDDIIEIAENMQAPIETEDILRHSFKCPPGMIDKMKIFIDLVKTDPSESDEMLLKKVAPRPSPSSQTSAAHSGIFCNFLFQVICCNICLN